MNVELAHEAAPMRLDRFDTQAQGRRNLLRRLPLRDALDYLTLPRGQRSGERDDRVRYACTTVWATRELK